MNRDYLEKTGLAELKRELKSNQTISLLEERERRLGESKLLAVEPNQPNNGHCNQNRSKNHGASEDIQFSLEFMIAGRNSV